MNDKICLEEIRERLLRMQEEVLFLRQVANDSKLLPNADTGYYDERLTQILEHFPYILESLQKLEKPSSQDLKDCEKVLDAMVEDFLEEIGEQMVFKDNN